MSEENITVPTTTGYSLNPQLSYCGTKTRVEFKESCLKEGKITYNHEKVVTIYIVYEILDIVLDLIEKDYFHILVVGLIEM